MKSFNIIQFFKSLVPSLNKKDILDTVEFVKKQLDDSLLPSYLNFTNLIGSKGLTSDESKTYDKAFQSRFKQLHHDNYLSGIQAVLQLMRSNIDTVEGLLQQNLSTDITKDGLTYQKASLIRYVEIMDFVTRYALTLLSWTISNETESLDKKANVPLTSLDIKWLQSSRENFFEALRVVSTPKSEFANAIKNIPDIMIDEKDNSNLEATVGKNKIDPLQLGLVVDTTTFNLGFHVLNFISDYQVIRYKKLEAERAVVENKILNYQMLVNGTQNARAQDITEKYQSRLNVINQSLKKADEQIFKEESSYA